MGRDKDMEEILRRVKEDPDYEIVIRKSHPDLGSGKSRSSDSKSVGHFYMDAQKKQAELDKREAELKKREQNLRKKEKRLEDKKRSYEPRVVRRDPPRSSYDSDAYYHN